LLCLATMAVSVGEARTLTERIANKRAVLKGFIVTKGSEDVK
jgi:hypothetical protein